MEEAPLLNIEGSEAQFLVPFLPNEKRCPSFSFRGEPDDIETINICPSSLRDSSRGQIYDDISFTSNYKLLEFSELLKKIPAI